MIYGLGDKNNTRTFKIKDSKANKYEIPINRPNWEEALKSPSYFNKDPDERFFWPRGIIFEFKARASLNLNPFDPFDSFLL